MATDTNTIEDAARECAGNHQTFESFIWYGRPDDARDNPKCWAILYTHNRDSGLTTRANAEEFNAALLPFAEGDNPDVIFQSHSHCLCGHIDGFAMRVYREGEITEAFRAYHALCVRLESYGILNETRHSEMQLEEIESGWKDWARHDFETGLQKRFGVDLRDGADLRPLWDTALDKGAADWHEESSGMTIDVRRVVKSIPVDDMLPLLDTAISQATERIVSLLIQAIEALPDAGSIYAGAGSCANLGGIPSADDLAYPPYADELFRILFYFKTQYAAVVESCGIVEPAPSKALCELDRIASIADR